MGNFTILTDPVLSARCSPSQLVGTHRYVDAAVSVDDLPKDINIVLISHDHYDHLDIDTITALGVDRPQIQYYVPMGTKDLLVNSCGIKENYVREMVWWQETKFESADTNAKIVCTPAQHWCSRTPFDRNKRLWCSWVVHTGNENESEKESENGRFFFGGDTGRPKHFPLYSLIGQKYGPFHLSALPVGAYSPTWFMSPAHCGPDEAIQIHQDLKSEQSVGIHWGTFPLADEPYFEPAQLLKRFCLEAGISFEKEFVLLYSLIGQKYGPFHLSALPVGAYSPTWFMSPAHCGPDEAIQIHQDLKSEQSVGIHWGTFPLADEPYFEPAQLLKRFCLEAGISFEKEFVLLRHGETLLSGEDNKTSEKLKTLLDCEL